MPLPFQAPHYLRWGLVAKTRITYHSARKSYISSCQIAGVSLFLALLFNLAYWIAELGVQNLKIKTIKFYLVTVRSSQIDISTIHNELKMFSHLTLFHTIAGIRHMNGEANTRERHPITRQVLLCIFLLFDATSLWGATMHSSFYLAFAEFLQIDEFTWSRADHSVNFQQWYVMKSSVFLYSDHLQLLLPFSKTDIFCAGITLTIVAAFNEAYAVSSIRNLFNQFPHLQNSLLFDLGPTTPFTQ